MVFQSYALYPHMTVARNMSFSLKLRGMPKAEIERRVKEVAAILGLTEHLNRKPRQLSGGQRQSVAVGAALCRQAGVLLFDEPLSNLDAKLRVHMRTELKRLHQAIQSTMVYVTHDQVEAMTMGDRIVIMNGGVICQVGTPARDLRPAGQPLRGRVHRQPADELLRRRDRRRRAGAGRPSARRRPRACRCSRADLAACGRPARRASASGRSTSR